MRRSLTTLLSWVSVVIAVSAALLFDISAAMHGFAWVLAALAGLIAGATYLYHRLHDSGNRETEHVTADLTKGVVEDVPSLEGAKIIVGTMRSKNKWLSLHLHDCFNAVSVRADEGVLVIAEGPGEGRIEDLVIPLKSVIRFETVDMRIGHRRVSKRNSDEADGEESATRVESFTPVMVRVIIGGINTSYYSIVDVGASPTVELVPLLRSLPNREAGLFERKAITCAEDCASIARDVVTWVRNVNDVVEQVKAEELISTRLNEMNASARTRRMLKETFHLSNEMLRSGVSLNRPVTIVSAFSNTPEVDRKDSSFFVPPDDIFNEIKAYVREESVKDTAIAAIQGCLLDLKASDEGPLAVTLTEILETRRPIQLLDPLDLLSEANGARHSHGLRHTKEVEEMLRDEGISIYYVPKLSFLSVLFQCETSDNETHLAVAIRSDVSQVLTPFLLAHELGHKALHCGPLASKESKLVMRTMLVSDQSGVLHAEADEFAMEILFPHSYLVDRARLYGRVNAEEVLDEFMAGLELSERVRISGAFRNEMLRYIRERVRSYQEDTRTIGQTTLTEECTKERGDQLRLESLQRDQKVGFEEPEALSTNVKRSGDDVEASFDTDEEGALHGTCFILFQNETGSLANPPG